MRGKMQILKRGAKQAVENFFRNNFPLGHLWAQPREVASDYDQWHRAVCRQLASCIRPFMGAKRNTVAAVAAKLLDTFMHQLMKTERLRVLWPKLHLPLDRRVFNAVLKRPIQFDGKSRIAAILKKPPYSITRKEYDTVQNSLWALLKRMPSDEEQALKWSSRIELNWLWI